MFSGVSPDSSSNANNMMLRNSGIGALPPEIQPRSPFGVSDIARTLMGPLNDTRVPTGNLADPTSRHALADGFRHVARDFLFRSEQAMLPRMFGFPAEYRAD